MTILHQIAEHGQSIWLDNLSRGMLQQGHLARRIAPDGLRGVTSNPAILSEAIATDDGYDGQLREQR